MLGCWTHDSNRGRVRVPAVLLSGNNLEKVVHTRASVTHIAAQFVPIMRQLCPAAGKVWWLSKGDDHPIYSPCGVRHTFTVPQGSN